MLQSFPYEQLWHYSEKFTRDQDLRQDLVLMAWQMDVRLAERSDIRLLKHYMKFRSKEIGSRNSLGKSVGGKSKKDVWSHDKVSINRHLKDGSAFTLADTLSSSSNDPFGQTVVNDFSDALQAGEVEVAQQIISGYTDKESASALCMPISDYRRLKFAVQEKAVEYLV